MKHVMKIAGCVLVLAVVLFQAACQPSPDDAKPPAPKPEPVAQAPAKAPEDAPQGPEMSAELRHMALTLTPDQIEVTVPATGDTSKDVRKVSRALLAELDSCTAQMEARPPQKLPAADSIRFYAHTRDGLLSTAEIPEADLQSSDHPLFPCYAAAQHVLTQVLQGSRKK